MWWLNKKQDEQLFITVSKAGNEFLVEYLKSIQAKLSWKIMSWKKNCNQQNAIEILDL